SFECNASTCPLGLHGPAGAPQQVRGTIATIRVVTQNRMIRGFALADAALRISPGLAAPARTDIVFSEAAEGPGNAFALVTGRSPQLPSRRPIQLASRARRIVTAWFNGHSHDLLVAPTTV